MPKKNIQGGRNEQKVQLQTVVCQIRSGQEQVTDRRTFRQGRVPANGAGFLVLRSGARPSAGKAGRGAGAQRGEAAERGAASAHAAASERRARAAWSPDAEPRAGEPIQRPSAGEGVEEGEKEEKEGEVLPRPEKQATLGGGGRNRTPNRRPAPGLGPARVRTPGRGGRLSASQKRAAASQGARAGAPRGQGARRAPPGPGPRRRRRGPGPARTYVGPSCSRGAAPRLRGSAGRARGGAAEVAAAGPGCASLGSGRRARGRLQPSCCCPGRRRPVQVLCCCAALGTADRPLRPPSGPAAPPQGRARLGPTNRRRGSPGAALREVVTNARDLARSRQRSRLRNKPGQQSRESSVLPRASRGVGPGAPALALREGEQEGVRGRAARPGVTSSWGHWERGTVLSSKRKFRWPRVTPGSHSVPCRGKPVTMEGDTIML
ncbi:translation initiation factor IF-2-like [Sciurus carolinensis]|uniref:translation initiation factor IF-2-like n=1 Tax=Sciurus carolinensis TaxID=30640 RepID=UPI001FB1B632|nr:translation initiation factor IF-2-like [Sciurus carolinensis]